MGKTLFELAKQAQPDYPHQIILAKVDQLFDTCQIA